MMLLIIIVSGLFTFLAIVFGSIVYLISAVLDESDDDGAAASLGIDSQDFVTTPVASPNDSPANNNEPPPPQLQAQPVSFIEGVCSCTLRERAETSDLAAPATGCKQSQPLTSVLSSQTFGGLDSEPSLSASDLEGATPDEIKSAELNSKLLKASARQREVARDMLDSAISDEAAASATAAGGVSRDSTTDGSSCGMTNEAVDNWDAAPTAQKDKLTEMLGPTLAKQIIDDLDPKEMLSGGSVLHWCKTRSTLDKLVKIGVPLNLVNKRKETALHVAIRRHKLQVLIGLLIHGADIEKSNELQETPLIVACQVRNIFAVQMLLIFEANFDSVDKFGQPARHHAAVICEHNKTQQNQQSPSAAHLILAMLNEIGAKRCPVRAPTALQMVGFEIGEKAGSAPSNSAGGSQTTQFRANASCPPPASRSPFLRHKQAACPEGCAAFGIYNGNSYNRWPNFKRESLYKRHMFEDIIEAHLAQARAQRRTNKTNSGNLSRLLCIDGGGLRGVIVCQILIEMEKHLKRPMASYFDWIGGTSVGAFIACSLSIGVPLKQLRQICFDVKDEVFSGGRPYNSKFLERVLKRTFGPERRLSEIKDKKLAVTTVLADREPIQLRMFRNYLSPSRILEKYGYASDTFNNMSGHSIVSNQHQFGTKKRSLTASKGVDVAKKAMKVSNSGTQSKDEIKSVSAIVAKNNDQRQQSYKELSGKENISGRETTRNNPRDNKFNSQLESSSKDVAVKQLETHVTPKTLAAINESDTNLDLQETILEENDPDPIIWKVVRASSAAPFFFKPYGPYLDGGIISNNPTLDMLNEFESYQKVRKFLINHIDREDIYYIDKSLLLDSESPSKLNLVVSLGTGRGRVIGRQTMVDFGQVASGIATVFSPLEFVRSLRAARDFFKKLMQQSCHTDDYILDRAQAWCSSLFIPYFRINPPLATIFSIDDKRDEQLINALWQTKLYMGAMKDQLSELGEILDGSR